MSKSPLEGRGNRERSGDQCVRDRSTDHWGLTNLEAIRAATISGAELLDWQDTIGSLETGKFADIIAVSGNPLSDIKQLEHVSFVMKGGIVIKDERKLGQ